jgi:uncharacterized protein YhhL (DUF1145 family)
MFFLVHLTPDNVAGNIAWRQWMRLSESDRTRYLELESSFQHTHRTRRARRGLTFAKELRAIINFIDSEPLGYELRCILTGIACVGRYILIHTLQLQILLGRLKSSINATLQDLRYVAIQSRSQARQCVAMWLPSMAKQREAIRQWGLLVAAGNVQCCSVSRFGLRLEDLSQLNEGKEPVKANCEKPNQQQLMFEEAESGPEVLRDFWSGCDFF